jgi:molybdenum cofactor biosynthesis enzyme MoaA
VLKSVQLNVYNISKMRQQVPRSFEAVRLDSNNDCNVHCVYCHNHRSKALIETHDLREFLNENVISVNDFQLGCGMEPTLDSRMCDLLLMIAGSRARPTTAFRLQTNAILLHKHDYFKIMDAGVTTLSVSIDAADPATHRLLRGGTSLAKVERNLLSFHQSCPNVDVAFMTTVTSLNIQGIEELVTFGLGVGARSFVLRQVFYNETSNIVDHTKMPALLVTADAFSEMKKLIREKFGMHLQLHFLDAPTIVRVSQKTRADSQF